MVWIISIFSIPFLIFINANIDVNPVETVVCCLKKNAMLPILLASFYFLLLMTFLSCQIFCMVTMFLSENTFHNALKCAWAFLPKCKVLVCMTTIFSSLLEVGCLSSYSNVCLVCIVIRFTSYEVYSAQTVKQNKICWYWFYTSWIQLSFYEHYTWVDPSKNSVTDCVTMCTCIQIKWITLKFLCSAILH